MAADLLSTKMESSMHITTKTVGDDRIRRAKENDEDIAVLSTFLPEALDDAKSTRNFDCALGYRCLLGDSRKAPAGTTRTRPPAWRAAQRLPGDTWATTAPTTAPAPRCWVPPQLVQPHERHPAVLLRPSHSCRGRRAGWPASCRR